MSRRMQFMTLSLIVGVSILFGIVVGTSVNRTSAVAAEAAGTVALPAPLPLAQAVSSPTFADIAERANPAVVSIQNTEIVSARSFGIVFGHLHPASTGGTPSGKHGDGLVSVRVQPQGADLSTSNPTTVKVSADLSFVATVVNSGDFQELNVPVTLTINAGGSPIVRRQSITIIQPAQQQTVTFSNFNLPTSAFGARATIKVDVAPVAGETNTLNNSATYSVFFTLSGP